MTNLSLKSCIVSVCHHQDGDSALIMAVEWGSTEVVSLLVKAGANTDLQNNVMCCVLTGVVVLLCEVYII